MSLSEYTNSDFTFEFHVVELLYVLNFKSLQLFFNEIQHILMCATYGTSGTWHRHSCHFMDIR